MYVTLFEHVWHIYWIRHFLILWIQVTYNGDTLLGKIMLPMHLIKTQALSSGSISGKIPLKSYTLRNAQDGKLPISLEMEIEFFCELLLR